MSSKKLGLLSIIVLLASSNLWAKSNVQESNLSAYFSNHNNSIYNGQNVYAQIKGKKGTSSVLIEDYSAAKRISLEENSLFLNVGSKKIYLASFEGINEIEDGQRVMLTSTDTIKVKELKNKTRRKLEIISCGGHMCGFGPHIRKTQVSLYQFETKLGEKFCLNREYYTKKPRIYLGNCN